MAVPTRIQTYGTNDWASGPGLTEMVVWTATTGNCLIICPTGYATAGQVIASVTDTKGNSYSKAGHCFEPTDLYRSEVWYAANVTGGLMTVTATWSASIDYRTIVGIEYAGLGATPFDTKAEGFGSAGTSVTSATLTTTRTDEVHLILSRLGSFSAMTYPAGFTEASPDTFGRVGEGFVTTPPYVGTYTITYPFLSGAPKYCFVVAFGVPSGPGAAERADPFIMLPV